MSQSLMKYKVIVLVALPVKGYEPTSCPVSGLIILIGFLLHFGWVWHW